MLSNNVHTHEHVHVRHYINTKIEASRQLEPKWEMLIYKTISGQRYQLHFHIPNKHWIECETNDVINVSYVWLV